MAGYIGTKAVLLSTTAATVTGDAEIAGDLTVDTNTLFVDSTNNRVGIGTTSPNTNLEILTTSSGGQPLLTLHQSDNTPGNVWGIEFKRTTDVGGANDTVAAINAFRSGGDATGISFYTNNSSGTLSEVMEIDSSGNLLLGTTAGGSSATRHLAFRSEQSGINQLDAQIFMGRNTSGSDYRAIVIGSGDYPNGPTNPGKIEWQDFASGNGRNCSILGSKGEVYVLDNWGNRTLISPHNFEMIPNGASEPMAWAYFSRVQAEDQPIEETDYVAADITKALRIVERLSGEKLVYTGTGEAPDETTVSENIIENLLTEIAALKDRVAALEAN